MQQNVLNNLILVVDNGFENHISNWCTLYVYCVLQDSKVLLCLMFVVELVWVASCHVMVDIKFVR